LKKFTCLLMAVLFTIAFATIAFAATGDTTDIPDATAPGSADTTTGDTYATATPAPTPPVEDITDDDTPQGADTGKTGDTDTIDFEEEPTPQSATLAKTGGIPAEAFYAIGALCIVAALILSRKKSGESKAN